MRKFMTVLFFGCLATTGIWWWQSGRAGDASFPAVRPETLQSLLRPDPVQIGIDGLPDGSRFISVIENVRTIQDLTAAIGSLQTDVDKTNAVVGAVQAVQKEILNSCATDIRRVLPVLSAATEKGEQLTSALAEVDAWLQRTVKFVQDARPAGGNSAAGLYQEFQRQRNEIEQSIKTIQALSESIPRLRKSNCEPFEIPPFRDSSN